MGEGAARQVYIRGLNLAAVKFSAVQMTKLREIWHNLFYKTWTDAGSVYVVNTIKCNR
jgi:hypothetical protein